MYNKLKNLKQFIYLFLVFLFFMSSWVYGAEEDLDKKFMDIINLTNMNAPVKIISRNKNEKEIVLMFNEIISEIKKIDLRKKIEVLEDKVSLNLDEKLYSELLSLRNQLKGG